MTRPALKAVSPLCEKPGCGKPEFSDGYCTTHDIIRTAASNMHRRERAAEIAAWDVKDTAGDRAVLLWLADGWESHTETLVARGMTVDQADATLMAVAWTHTHPAAREASVFLLAGLRSALDRQRRFELGAVDPRDVVDGVVWGGLRRELAAERLQADVDEALAPLLTGARS